MKTAGVIVVLTLVLLCCFTGVASEPPNQNDCSAYPEPPKGQSLLCMNEYSPVCGTDGVMYDNQCLLCAAKWETGGKLSLQPEGVCRIKIDCSRYQTTKEQQRQISCPRNYAPVCGTNGVTYTNECFLCRRILNGANIDLAYRGKCKKIDCSRYQTIKVQQQRSCPRILQPVCGTDGVTYSNECLLCEKILNGANIDLAHQGNCRGKDDCGQFPKQQKGNDIACTLEYRPVCGTNGITYSNKCFLCLARWKTGRYIGIRHEGRCNRKSK